MFYNIFSEDSKEPSEKMTKIIIDQREKNSLVIANLVERKANIGFEFLKIADYLIGDIAIERKSFSDFISSMINKRLVKQLSEIKKYPRYFLMIEGKRFCESPNLDKAVKGMILSVISNIKVPIIFSENEEETAEFLIILAKQQEKNKQEFGLRYSPRLLTAEQQKQFILEGFPGVGPKTAKKLLEKFGTLKNIINSQEEDLKKILGKKYEKFKELLD